MSPVALDTAEGTCGLNADMCKVVGTCPSLDQVPQ